MSSTQTPGGNPVPAFLKPSLQHKMAAAAARLGDLNEWMASQSSPQLLRGQGRRYFGTAQGSIFRQTQTWVRKRGLGGL